MAAAALGYQVFKVKAAQRPQAAVVFQPGLSLPAILILNATAGDYTAEVRFA
jgi:hypothetical protein